MVATDDWLIDLYEGDIFGEEACFDACTGSNRSTTAVTASASGSEDIELLCVSRQQYDEIRAPHLQLGRQQKHPSGIHSVLENSSQLLSMRKQSM